MIKVAKSKKRTNVLDLIWLWPVFDSHNFDRVNISHPLFKDYPQVIDTRGVEDAFFRFEIKVVFGGEGEYIAHGGSVIGVGRAHSNGYIVHVKMNRSTQ